jgi:hypothetical protein
MLQASVITDKQAMNDAQREVICKFLQQQKRLEPLGTNPV